MNKIFATVALVAFTLSTGAAFAASHAGAAKPAASAAKPAASAASKAGK